MDEDTKLWLDAIPAHRPAAGSEAEAYYVTHWHVAAKVRDAKARGDWPPVRRAIEWV